MRCKINETDNGRKNQVKFIIIYIISIIIQTGANQPLQLGLNATANNYVFDLRQGNGMVVHLVSCMNYSLIKGDLIVLRFLVLRIDHH